jgi:hypothetical protein
LKISDDLWNSSYSVFFLPKKRHGRFVKGFGIKRQGCDWVLEWVGFRYKTLVYRERRNCERERDGFYGGERVERDIEEGGGAWVRKWRLLWVENFGYFWSLKGLCLVYFSCCIKRGIAGWCCEILYVYYVYMDYGGVLCI